MSDTITIQVNGQTYASANGGCADCDLDDVEQACFQVPKLTGERGCCCGKCWKIVQTTACKV